MQVVEAREAVASMYRTMLMREPDDQGLEFYTGEVASGRLSLPAFAGLMVNSPEFRARVGADPAAPSERPDPVGCTRREAMAVFERFDRYTGSGRPGFITNFLGGLTATRHVNLPELSGCVEGYPIPRNFHADTLEWLGTLRAVLDAKSSFTMIELGAGWAPWCTIGTIAAKQKGLVPHVTAVEGDSGHVGFIRSSFAENGHVPRQVRILHGIVGARDGQASFPRVKDASLAYGGAARYDRDGGRKGGGDAHFHDFVEHVADQISEVDVLPCYGLATLLREPRRVDLIHCDVQGAEHDVFEAAMEVMRLKVRRVLVGTHSLELDRQLIKLFSNAGWSCEGIDSATMLETAAGPRLACDGTQLWRNDRFP